MIYINKGIKLTPQLMESISQDYQQGGLNGLQLAIKYALPKSTIYRALEKLGIKANRKDSLFAPKVISDDTKQEIVLKYKNKFSLNELCKEYKLAKSTITKILVESGVVVTSNVSSIETKTIIVGNVVKTILSEGDQLDVCNKYRDTSKTHQELADEYHVHIDTIRSILRRHGVGTKKYLPEEIVTQFCHDYKEGTHSLGDLVRIYRISPETIRYWLVKHGLMVTPKVSLSLQDVEKLQGMSPPQFKKWCRERSPEWLEIMEDMVRNPEVNERTRAMLLTYLVDHTFGKASEVPEEATPVNTTNKVLEMLSNKNNIFSKK